ncbi:MAG TPA: ASCH domain-containing protein [Bacteroidia bacterium]|nr:ASCH domain-containing protein [Bacteroidia bacterium]
MPALNFQERFALQVQNGTKRQTIRKRRKRPIKIGDKLFLYTGMRTKSCVKLGEGVCIETVPVTIHNTCLMLYNRAVPGIEAHRLAHNDGFESLDMMLRWFRKTHGLPFKGQIIFWRQS